MVLGLRILDGACGTGYGTSLLRGAGAASVAGVDLSPDSIDEATRLYATPGLSFHEGDLLHLDFANATFDVVVSFESIEHVDDDVKYASEMRRVLRDGGIFVCSTPNRTVTNPGTTIHDKPYNPFHVREYNETELKALLSSVFGRVSLLGQMAWSSRYCSTLASVATHLSPIVAVRFHQINKLLHSLVDKKEHFVPHPPSQYSQSETLIAVCS